MNLSLSRGIRISVILAVIFFDVDSSHAQRHLIEPKLLWIGAAHGDIYKAEVLIQQPDNSSTGDYLVHFDPRKFDPFHMYDTSKDRNPLESFDRIMLFVELPADTSMLAYHLNIAIDKAIPLCADCDGGCWRLKERRTQAITAVLNSGSTPLRYLISVSDFIADWHLMDINLTATLTLNQKQILKSRTHAEKWPWCL